MSNKKNIILYLVSVVIGVIVGVIVYKVTRNSLYTVGAFLITVIISMIIGALVTKKHKEKYTTTSKSSDGCVQNITINQNCDDGDHPYHPINPALSKADIVNWIKRVNPKLTSECQECIVDSAFDLWSVKTLNDVKKRSMKEQKKILNALLAFDCNKQCVIPSQGLKKSDVESWLNTVVHRPLDGDCYECIVNTIMRLWSPEDLVKVQRMDPVKQKKVVQGIWALDCTDCEDEHLDKEDVEDWLSTVLTGTKPDCYNCVVDNIMKLWSMDNFHQAQKMSKDSQRQLIESLIDIHCISSCINVPTGLNKQKVIQWVTTNMTGANQSCYSCVIEHIMKLWTPAMFSKVTSKPHLEQNKILQGIIALNCYHDCVNSALTKDDIIRWVKQVLPKSVASCQRCIVEQGEKMWTKKEFVHLQSLPHEDQVKTAMLVADYNCPHVCKLEPQQC